ncbi:hypothetical protein A5721_23950 [Mycobacterium vulneris]|nr:hypothetical protein A5721_23950 [Mycolicibacterium vulneris]
MSANIIIPGDEAYLSFGGWAKPMKNPPALHERRRYVVDVECTDASLKTSSKGERGTRSLSILRVTEVAGVTVPPRPNKDDEDEDTPPMFDEQGQVIDDASADEGDEIMAERREAAEAAADKGVDQESGDPWPGDAAADADVADDPDNVPPTVDDDDPQAGDVEVIDEATDGEEWSSDEGNVTSLFREAGGA